MMMTSDTIRVTAMTEAATQTARLMGAAFGFTGNMIQQHPDYTGMGLTLFSSGMTMLQISELVMGTPAFVAMMGAVQTNDAFVDHVYQNVTGMMPSRAEHNYFVGLLQGSGGAMSQAELLMYAANTDANAQHIDLVGLQHSGMMFV